MGPCLRWRLDIAVMGQHAVRPVVVHPTKRADVSRHGYRVGQFEDAFARFLPPEPNIRTLKRGDIRRRAERSSASPGLG